MPGLQPPQRDIESYGAVVNNVPSRKKDGVHWRTYLLALLDVIGHCCLVALIAWLSISFAHWDEVNAPTNLLDRATDGLIQMGAYDDPSRCWQFSLPDNSLRPDTRFASRFCELTFSSLTEARFRSLLACFGAPLCALQTMLNWFDAKHFPLTVSRSFYVVRTSREMERKPVKLTSVDLTSAIVMGAFFFYCGIWALALLFMQLHDVKPGLPRLQVASQLLGCALLMLIKLRPIFLCFVVYATCGCVGSQFGLAGWLCFLCVLFLSLYLSPDPRRRDRFHSRPVLKHMHSVALEWTAYLVDNM